MCAIEIPMYLTILLKQAFPNFLLKFLLVDKIVLSAILLARTWFPCGDADTQFKELGVSFQQEFYEGPFASTRASAYYEGLVFWGRGLRGVGLEVLEDLVLHVLGIGTHAYVDDFSKDLFQILMGSYIGCLLLCEDGGFRLRALLVTDAGILHKS